MTQAPESVITFERFAKGKVFQAYLESGIRNRELFEDNYKNLTISDEQAKALKDLAARPDGPHHLVVIGEDWCPDVYRGAGIAQRIAETMGIEMRFFERDQNKDMIAEYRHHGEFESIPVAVFYAKDMEYIAHWSERPALANEQMRTELRDMYIRLRKPDKTDQEREAAKQETIAFQNGPIWGGWRHETVREVIELLRSKLS